MSNQSKSGPQPGRGRGDMDATVLEVQMEDASGVSLQGQKSASRPVGHQERTSNKAIQRLTEYLSEKGAAQEMMEAWECVLEDLGAQAPRGAKGHVTSAILEMKAEIQEMRAAAEDMKEDMKEGMRIMGNKLTGLSLDSFQTTTSGSSGKTYASVAAGAEPRRVGQPLATTGIKPVPVRLGRELVIQTGDKEFSKTGAQIVPLVNNQMATGKAIACRKLTSGDYILTLDLAETKEYWEQNTPWLSAFGTKARISRREFNILAYGIVINQV